MIVPVIQTIATDSRTLTHLSFKYFFLSLLMAVLPITKRAPSRPQIAPDMITKGRWTSLKLSSVICVPNLMSPVLARATYCPSLRLTQIFRTKVARELAQNVLRSKVKVQ